MTKTEDLTQAPTLLVFPLTAERGAFCQALAETGLVLQARGSGPNLVYFSPEKNWLVCTGGLGKVEFALSCQTLLSLYPHARGLISLGSAGALHESLHEGDLIIATEIIEHDFKSSPPEGNPPHFPCHIDWLQIPDREGLQFGPIASGDENISDPQRRRELQAQTGALAVAWEGAGAARACRRQKRPHVEVRVISDLCEGIELSQFKQKMPQLMRALASLLLEVR